MQNTKEVLDEKGFVRPGYPILIYLPAWDAYIPLLVKTRANLGYEDFEYGPLPDCGDISNGVIPAGGKAANCTFSYSQLPPETAQDMFYYIYNDRLMHVYVEIRPVMLRILLEIPQGSKPYSLYGLVAQDLTRDFGWFRCCKEMVFPPKIHVGWDFYNPTNLDLKTWARFHYAEYIIEPIKDADVITKILVGKIPAHVVPFGGLNRFREIDLALSTWNAVMISKPPVWFTESQVKSFVQEQLRQARR